MTGHNEQATPVLNKHDLVLTHITKAGIDDVDAILRIEQAAYSHPWSRASFIDIISRQGTTCGDYVMQMLWTKQAGVKSLQGYFIAMLGLDEMHLLNLAVHRDFRAQGCGLLLLQQLKICAQWYGARVLWLEVRQSNWRAQEVYRRFGFTPVATRKHYYPTSEGTHEDAVVMQLLLQCENTKTQKPN